jgi:hypothetical protein
VPEFRGRLLADHVAGRLMACLFQGECQNSGGDFSPIPTGRRELGRSLPEGTLDSGRLAILSDALLDAGCDNEELIAHCRSPGPHVRGCWALDQILDKA